MWKYIKYTLISAIVVITLVMVIKGINSYIEYNKEKKNISHYITEISLGEVEDVVREFGLNGFIYVNSDIEEELNFERKLKNIIKRNNLSEEFYYINSFKIENINYIEILNEELKTKDKLVKTPAIIYYKENEFNKVININLNNYEKSIEELNKLINDK